MRRASSTCITSAVQLFLPPPCFCLTLMSLCMSCRLCMRCSTRSSGAMTCGDMSSASSAQKHLT